MEKKYMRGEDYLKLEAKLTDLGFDQIKAIDLIAGRQFLDPQQKICFLHYSEIINGDRIEGSVKFDIATDQQLYNITGFSMTLKKSDGTVQFSQVFIIPENSAESRLTKREAYNLMDGRSVLKALPGKQVWLSIDFTRKNDSLNLSEIQSMVWTDVKSLLPENYIILEKPANYLNLETAIMQYDLKEALVVSEKKELINKLCAGNRETATQLGQNGTERTVSVEAEPCFGIIKLFDEYGRRIKVSPTVTKVKDRPVAHKKVERIRL